MYQWIIGLVAAGAMCLGGMAALATHEAGAVVVVDMEVSAGGRVELFLNDLSRPPLTQRLEQGRRAQYAFPVAAEDISLIRLDPTDDPSAAVRIHSLEVTANGRRLARFDPPALLQWQRSGFEPTVADDVLAFTAATSDPVLSSQQVIPVPALPWWRRLVRAGVLERPVLVACLGLPLLALAAVRGRRRQAILLIACAAMASIPFGFAVGAGDGFEPPAVEVALSRAAFLGLSAGPARAAVGVGLLLAGLAALIAGVATRGRAPHALPATPGRERATAALFIAATAAIAALLAPDLPGTLASFRTHTYYPHWDSDNINYWAFLAARGDLPFRDYWYTYGGQYLFDLNWPLGPALRWVFEVALYAVMLGALLIAAPQRRVGAVLAVAGLIAAERIGLTPLSTRYLLGIDLIAVYLAIASASSVRVTHVALALVAMTIGVVVEVVQLAYAAPAIAAACVVDLACTRPRSVEAWKAALRAPIVLVASGTAVLLVVALLLASSGQLSGAVEFYRTLGEAVEYVTFPTTFDGLGWRVLDTRLAVLWWPVLAVALGLFERLSADSPEARPRGLAMLALGVLFAVVLQKHLVRPMDAQLWIYPVAGLIVFLVLLPRPVHAWGAVTAGLCIGALAAVVPARAQVPLLTGLVRDAPARVSGTLSLMMDPARTSLANGERFAPARFGSHVPEVELVDGLRQRSGRMPTVFCLTDSPIVYLLTGQPAVWSSNMYNASPLREQARVVSWLKSGEPEYVVLRRDRLEWDSFALVLRVPDIVRAVQELYTPDSRIGVYEVLRRRQPGEPFDLKTWREWLGGTLNLGHLPASIDVERRGACSGNDCDEYLLIDMPAPVQAGHIGVVAFDLDGLPFELQFALTPDRQRYVVPLSRLWFWPHSGNARTRTSLRVAVPEGTPSWTLATSERDPERLY